MADGATTITLTLDEELAAEMRAEADRLGITLQELAQQRVSHPDWFWSDDPDPAIDDRIADETIRRGDGIPWEQVKAWLESWGKPDELRPPKWRK